MPKVHRNKPPVVIDPTGSYEVRDPLGHVKANLSLRVAGFVFEHVAGSWKEGVFEIAVDTWLRFSDKIQLALYSGDILKPKGVVK